MKRFICLAVMTIGFLSLQASPGRDYYQLLVYHFKTANQEKLLDEYLQKAFLPSMHKMGYRQIGIFSPITNDTAIDKKIYILLTLKNPDEMEEWNLGLLKNKSAESNVPAFWESPYSDPPYTRFESILIKAWAMAPKLTLPALTGPQADRIFELRSYESATDKLYRNKVQMFNEGGEIKLFARLNFNAVFYGDVLAGSNMPNLMYMTSFNNITERDAHWKAFVDDAEWKKLLTMPEYQHNVSKSDIILMHPKPYSDF